MATDDRTITDVTSAPVLCGRPALTQDAVNRLGRIIAHPLARSLPGIGPLGAECRTGDLMHARCEGVSDWWARTDPDLDAHYARLFPLIERCEAELTAAVAAANS